MEIKKSISELQREWASKGDQLRYARVGIGNNGVILEFYCSTSHKYTFEAKHAAIERDYDSLEEYFMRCALSAEQCYASVRAKEVEDHWKGLSTVNLEFALAE